MPIPTGQSCPFACKARILISRYEICGAAEDAVGDKPDWLTFIMPEHREDADALWNDVYHGGLATKTAEWQFANGRWGE